MMSKTKDLTTFLNPGQTPVMEVDEPLYVLAKKIQWTWVDEYGEDKFVVIPGGLHIEQAAFKSIGSLLELSGWTHALTVSGVPSSGRVESHLHTASITRTRQAHQITSATLYKLLQEAHTTSSVGGEPMSLEEFVEVKRKESPLFSFWYMILTMELAVLAFIRSIR